MTDSSSSRRDSTPPGDDGIRWWRPGWRDIAARMKLGWLLLLAVTLLLALAATGAIVVGGWALIGAWIKVIGMLVGIGVCVVGYAVRRAVQARREPFCIFCGYNLTGLPDHHRCPECGRAYTWEQIDDYRRDPQWFIERWKARQMLPSADRPVDTGPPRPRSRSRDGTG